MSEFESYIKIVKDKSIIPSLPDDNRLTTLPIARGDLWNFYKIAQKAYWVPDEINIAADINDYIKMSSREQLCVRKILGFFATGDAIVNINLARRFKQEVSILEADYFYDFQIMMENIHAETYSMQLMTIIPDMQTRNELLNLVNENPAIGAIAKWMYDTIDSDEPLSLRLLRMACVEGLFFSGCFCLIYWFASRKLMPGLAQANLLISRDEGLHTAFALHLYNLIENKPAPTAVYKIISDAVAIAEIFVSDMMPEPMPEMNAKKMTEYIKYLADDLLISINMPIQYKITENPMEFMQLLGLDERTNFFEHRSTQYSKVSTIIQTAKNYTVISNADTMTFASKDNKVSAASNTGKTAAITANNAKMIAKESLFTDDF
jgi:ribonucleotide reductase beta subunit family protein with ferritin-like domain